MAHFYGQGSTASRLQRHKEETAYLPPLRPQEYLVHILSTSKQRKAESTLEALSGFEPRTLGLEIQHVNH